MVEELYVSADGSIYPDCNLSYDDMESDYEQVPIENALPFLTGLLKEELAEAV
jgi:hypothetical protein